MVRVFLASRSLRGAYLMRHTYPLTRTWGCVDFYHDVKRRCKSLILLAIQAIRRQLVNIFETQNGLHLLQADVAQLLRVTEVCIPFWERSDKIPRIDYFLRIMKFLGHSLFKFDTSKLSGKVLDYITDIDKTPNPFSNHTQLKYLNHLSSVGGLQRKRESYCTENSDQRKSVYTTPFAKKVYREIVPTYVKGEYFSSIRKELDPLGINRFSIFPDLDDFCKHLE